MIQKQGFWVTYIFDDGEGIFYEATFPPCLQLIWLLYSANCILSVVVKED